MDFKVLGINGVDDFRFDLKEKNIYNNLISNRFNIIRHSRQMGISTLLMVITIDKVINNPNEKIIFIYSTMNFYKLMLQLFINLCNVNNLNHLISEKNVDEIKFKNGSSIEFRSSSTSFFGRDLKGTWVIFDGYSYNAKNNLVLADVCRYENINITIASTPIPKDPTDFTDLCINSMLGLIDFKYSEYLWWDHPNYSEDLCLVKGDRKLPMPQEKDIVYSLLDLGFKRSSIKYEEIGSFLGFDLEYELDCKLDI